MTIRQRRASSLGVHFVLCLIFVVCGTASPLTYCLANPERPGPLLLRDPTLSRTQVAFSYAGSIWVVNRDGSNLIRLTHGARDRKPCFSPDGTLVAYTQDYIDNSYQLHQSGGIFVVPATGGPPRQITYHPADLAVSGWTADGKRLIFTSKRMDFELHRQTVVQLFSVPAAGGYVSRIPLPRAAQASLSPDGKQIAYVPNVRSQPEWKHYQGGQTTPIWIASLGDSSIQASIPRSNSNDSNPMWIGNTVYFLSDRSGSVTLYSYDVHSQNVRQILKNPKLDIKSASAAADGIVYEQFGALHLLDTATGRDRVLEVRPQLDSSDLQPHLGDMAANGIAFAQLSPTGDEVLFGLHGEVLTAPVGSRSSGVRNLTATTDVSERDPSWSPDGRSVAYFSDQSGEYALHIQDRGARRQSRSIDLGNPPGFYYGPLWSPDAANIAYTDQRLNYWYVDLGSGRRVRIDTDLYVDPHPQRDLTWSPDSRWIAYTRQLPNHLHAVFVHSLSDGRSYQITDGRSDALHVAFDKDGSRLYFTASTDVALANGWLQMSSLRRPVTRMVYAIDVTSMIGLAKGGAGPDRLSRLFAALGVPPRNYCDLIAGPPGLLYLVEWPQLDPRESVSGADAPTKVLRLDVKTEHLEQVLDEVVDIAPYPDMRTTLRFSADGGRMLYAKKGRWFVASSSPALPAATTALDFDSVQMYVDPRAEWRHMFLQVWRDQRDFFYDPQLHGLDITTVKNTYEPFLDNIVTRDDLDYLFNEMLANLTVGHLVSLSKESHPSAAEGTGFLGADYEVDHGHYRFSRIYTADPWNPEARAPLEHAGIEVRAGDVLLAVDGHEVRPTVDIYSYFAKTADKQVVLSIAPHGDVAHASAITVTAVGDETLLRNYGWVEDNRRKVEKLSGGRVAYIYLPDVWIYGYQSFNRDYFSQIDKEAIIIDERYNYGGMDADYIINCLSRPLMTYHYTRYGRDIAAPQGVLFGPKAMIINEMAASGGDLLPWMFRKAGLGPLIGMRTWGGLVGDYTLPDDLIDGGFVSTPNLAFYDSNGDWVIENQGVAPDIEVEQDPKLVRQSRDPQLEQAIATVLDMLQKQQPAKVSQHPPFPNYQSPEAPTYQTKLEWSGGLH